VHLNVMRGSWEKITLVYLLHNDFI
jgi:hypothetical protein